MRSYVVATGVVFGLLTLAHLWRIVEEPHLASDPWFILITITAARSVFRGMAHSAPFEAVMTREACAPT